MSTISTHVLDTARGSPANGVRVTLEAQAADGWVRLGSASTDADGRAPDLLHGEGMEPGVHRLTFDTGSWFRQHGTSGFYPEVTVLFEITEADGHYHVPLLLSPFGYSTYRGS